MPPGLSPGEVQLWNCQPLVMINPVITKVSQELAILEEGCLSIPGINVEVVRPSEIELEATIILERGLGRVNRKIKLHCGNLLATCFQHEVDHLDGILFVDRASDEDKKMIKKSLKKLEETTLKKLK
jgi:peptide deformylase